MALAGPLCCSPMIEPAHSALIWSVADLLRGAYQQSEHGRVILSFTVLRRPAFVAAAIPLEPAMLYEALRNKAPGAERGT